MNALANVNAGDPSPKEANVNAGREPAKASLAVPVVSDTAAALHYAERRRDDDALSAPHLTEAFSDPHIREAIEQIAHDVEDRDRRVIVMIQRLDEATQRTGLALAHMLDGRTFTRADTGVPSAIKSIEDVKTAIDEALAASADGPGAPSAFVETGIVDDETSVLAAMTLDKDAHDLRLLSAWLKERNARLVIALTASVRLQPRTAASRRPGSYIMPWARLWLFDLAAHVELDYRELHRGYGAKFDEIERVDKIDYGIREENLFFHAREIRAKYLDHRGNYESLKTAFEEAIKGADSAQHFKQQAKLAFEAMFDSTQSVKVSNAICRILFAVTILVGNPPEAAGFALTRALLPEGEAPLELMSKVRRARWRRDIESDSELRRDRRPPPSWTEIFDDDQGAFLEAANIELTAKLQFDPVWRLRYVGSRNWLRTKTSFLRELAERVKTRGIGQTIDRVHVPVFADFLAGLRDLDESFFPIDDFVAAYTGNRGTQDISVRRQVDEGLLPEQLRAFARKIHFSGDVLRLAKDEDFLNEYLEGSARNATEADEQLRIKAAGDIFGLLNYTVRSTNVAPEFLSHFVERLDQCLSFRNCWIIFAYNVLYGDNFKIDDKTLGASTLKPFVGTGREAFHLCLVQLRETLRSMIGGAMDQAPERLAPFDYWADAVWAVAEHHRFVIFGKAIAVYIDDYMSSCEIVWSARTLDPTNGAPSVLAPQFLGARVARRDPNLLQRLFDRDAKDYLGLLDRLGHLAFDDPDNYVAGEVERLLKDVFWVLIDEIDVVEASRPEMDRDTLERIVWGAITEAFRLPLCSTAQECRNLIMGSADPKALYRRGIALLDLYAPALLLHWRFRALPPAPMQSGTPEEMAFRRCLEGLRTSAQSRSGSIFKAFHALQSAERRLVSHFRAQGCPLTEARHEVRRKVIAGIGRFFAPLPVHRG